MPWLKSHYAKSRPVERDGLYTKLSDGTEVIDCQAMVRDTGLPISVIKSEIEQHNMHGRHFFKEIGSMVERGCYETWKAERLAALKAKLDAKRNPPHA
jgi:hypothetical protein